MDFATIGAGTVAQAIAGHLVAAGHKVTLSNSRGPDTLQDVVTRLGPLASAGTPAEAAAADMVFLTVRWPQVGDALAGLPEWDGRILVDTTNNLDSMRPSVADLGVETASEFVAERAPGARVVKAFNTLFAQYIAADPRHADGRQLLFYAGDDEAAKADFRAVADALGFAPVDAGTLREGGRLMQVGGPLSALHALKQD
ncbi:putative dinucleotide-binding enzyme [Amycolatopsis lexingtonensis]|uniref:Dinucleotide-binding enzyme n=1 Tax=Amycolatopsis lexingtonensis TaxID=218822 RepID=A0ABR9HSK0_9PSEU|nr:NAD(P)-binding domain-containing protein [Amycolatopsis lexingtonensis]MBE1493901.1 putative dinucleotide-binding enzyme [Amycolatopsis lexingtonensis]